MEEPTVEEKLDILGAISAHNIHGMKEILEEQKRQKKKIELLEKKVNEWTKKLQQWEKLLEATNAN